MYNQTNYTRLLLLVAIALFCLLVWLTGKDLNAIPITDLFRNASTASFITLLFHIGFSKWIWKCGWIPLLNPLIVLVPNLNGTWKGTLKSSWINPETNQQLEPIEITAFIRQTFTTISVEVRTSQMISTSYIAGFKKDQDAGTCQLCYTYSSHAFAETVATNPWHDGTAKLQIHDGKELKLKGDYWTLRKTTGVMELHRTSKKIEL